MPCTVYEFQLKPVCELLQGNYSVSYEFTTTGCCIYPSSPDISIANGQAGLQWPAINNAISYFFQYRKKGSTEWDEVTIFSNTLFITDLDLCLIYEFRIATNCMSGIQTEFSPIQEFSSEGCGACLDQDYCLVGPELIGNTWISRVKFGDIDHISANENDGYSDFTNITTNLIKGYFGVLEIETDYNFFPTNSIFQVWIDYDQDGEFNGSQELIYDPAIPGLDKIEVIIIPNNIPEGRTRMRISARDQNFDPCGLAGINGEVEDYCVQIISSDACLIPGNIQITPSVAEVKVQWLGTNNFDSFNLQIRLKGTTTWEVISVSSLSYYLTDLLPCADYEVAIQTVCSNDSSLYSKPILFRTMGCGACLDQDYCIPEYPTATFEWIESVNINSLSNISGFDTGYFHFDDISTQLLIGSNYNIDLTPGFATALFEEYFKVWIDYNQDGIFDDDIELAFDAGATTTTMISGNISIPSDALEGSTRMRVTMKYTNPASPCEGNFDGEIEDYCIDLAKDLAIQCLAPSQSVYAQNLDQSVKIEWEHIEEKSVYHLRYREFGSINNWNLLVSDTNNIRVLELQPCQEYEYQVRTVCLSGLSTYSSLYSFESPCKSTSTEQFDQAKQLIVYPNPFEHNLSLELTNSEEKILNLEIYDLLGQRYFSRSFTEGDDQQSIDVNLSLIHI